MQPQQLWTIGIGVGVMALTAWFCYPRPSQNDLPLAERRFMHCLQCGKEVRYDHQIFEKGCRFCIGEPPLYPTKEPYAESPSNFGLAKMLAPLLLELSLTFGVLLYLANVKPSGRRKDDEPAYIYKCPKCKRKLRYRASLSGRAGRCPTCGRAILFPTAPEGDVALSPSPN